MKVLHVDMPAKKLTEEPVPSGCHGFSNRVSADCDPFGPDNILLFAPGYFSGTP
ncbi:hypothetical protein [uncultured Desulfosarcina sp.]|uniref:hypothetical protein n=1 Tax=uncultured Desulfosarcina sp. TaxID=218289 RepID=UPI0029C64EF9|nr:hypothetical protein [uncultured Desulfosarcina sp.]